MADKNGYNPLVRLNEDDYIKPKVTFTDKINDTQESVQDMLINYNQVPIEDIKVGTLVRYVVITNGKQLYRQGGKLINKKGLPAYVVLTNGTKSWSVQATNAQFYTRMSIKDIESEYNDIINEMENEINQLKVTVGRLTTELDHYKKLRK